MLPPTVRSMRTSDDDRPRRYSWSTAFRLLAAATVTVLALRLGGLGVQDMRQALALIGRLDAGIVAVVLGVQVTWVVGLSRVLATATSSVGGRIDGLAAVQTSMAAFTVSRVVPGGGYAGGLLSGAELTRRGNPAAVAAAALAASWAVSTATLTGLLLTGGSLLAAFGLLPADYAVPVIAGSGLLGAVALTTLVALCSAPCRRLLWKGVGRLPASVSRQAGRLLNTLPGGADTAIARPRLLWHCSAWSMLAWICDAAALWLVFAALGHPPDATALVVGYGWINLMNSSPELTPGWIGVFEVAVAATFTALGVPAELAIAGVVVYRLVSFWLPVAAGVVPALRIMTLRRAARHVDSSNRPGTDAQLTGQPTAHNPAGTAAPLPADPGETTVVAA